MGQQMTPDTARLKCKNFLATLLRLASEQPPVVATNVRNLIQGLIDGQVEAEIFTTRLQRELNSSPQPCLVPFLKKSLPYLQSSLRAGELTIDGVRAPNTAPPAPNALPQARAQMNSANNLRIAQQQQLRAAQIRLQQQPVVSQAQMGMASGPRPTIITPQLRAPQGPHPPGAIGVRTATGAVAPLPNVTNPATTSAGMTTAGLLRLQRMPHNNIAGNRAGGAQQGMAPMTSQGGVAANRLGVAVSQPGMMQTPQQISPSMAQQQQRLIDSKLGKKNRSSMYGTPGVVPGGGAASNFASSMPGSSSGAGPSGASSSSHMQQSSSTFSTAGDEDINDVAAMGGVNLAEESQRMQGVTDMIGTTHRSCKDETFLQTGLLGHRIAMICRDQGLAEPPPEVVALVSHATQDRLKTLLEKLSVVAEHRMDVIKLEGPQYEMTQDVKGQLKFVADLDRLERRRHDEAEREMLIRAVKSRTKTDDPEKELLKARAKEAQRLEEEQMRHEKANNTALLAIGGPKSKRLRLDDPFGGAFGPGKASNSAVTMRPRTKRVHLRDLMFLMEQEKELKRSPMLWKAYNS